MNGRLTPTDYGGIFARHLKSSSILPRPDSPYYRLADEIMTMAVSYVNDGGSFQECGDPVNEHAAYAYGFGWLDLGIMSGLIATKSDPPFAPDLHTCEFEENMPAEHFDKLFEKTNRYKRMFTGAIGSVKVAPDIESPLHKFAVDVGGIAEGYLRSGTQHLDAERYMNALAHFSYGYGYLDGAVRAGCFIILDNRDLFTV